MKKKKGKNTNWNKKIYSVANQTLKTTDKRKVKEQKPIKTLKSAKSNSRAGGWEGGGGEKGKKGNKKVQSNNRVVYWFLFLLFCKPLNTYVFLLIAAELIN